LGGIPVRRLADNFAVKHDNGVRPENPWSGRLFFNNRLRFPPR
jgi:hypothetical protein